MIIELVNSLKSKLQGLYPTFNIYTEADSGNTEPAFLIEVTECKRELKFGSRKMLTIELDISCSLASQQTRLDYYNIAEVLNENLELIAVDNNYYHTENHRGTFGTELHYRFSITIPYLIASEGGEIMGDIAENIGYKE